MEKTLLLPPKSIVPYIIHYVKQKGTENKGDAGIICLLSERG